MNKEGFKIIRVSEEVKTIKVRHEIPMYDIQNRLDVSYNIEEVKQNLVHRLVEELVKNRCVKTYEDINYSRDSLLIVTEVNIVEDGPKYVNYFDNRFIVKGVSFTNDELIEAVKNTFPERLI